MKLHTTSRLALLACALLSDAALTHHAQIGYDHKQVKSIRGTVVGISWGSPHAEFLLDVVGSDGHPTRWRVESDPAGVLERRGWNRTAFSVGDTITVELHARKNGEPDGILLSVTTADGELRRVGGRQTRRQSRAR